MKLLTTLGFCSGVMVFLVASQMQANEPIFSAHPNIPVADIVPATPRSADIIQSVHGTPVHFNAFETINLNDTDGHDEMEFGISLQELNLHLVNQRTGNRLI